VCQIKLWQMGLEFRCEGKCCRGYFVVIEKCSHIYYAFFNFYDQEINQQRKLKPSVIQSESSILIVFLKVKGVGVDAYLTLP